MNYKTGPTTVALSALFVAACTSGKDPDQIPPTGGTSGTTQPTPTSTTGGGGTDSTGTDTMGSGTDTSGMPENCFELACTGHGTCVEGSSGPECQCDPGYVLDPLTLTDCLVDETCINIKSLQPECRQKWVDEPAVAMFFAVDFCSGDAVLPAKLQELGLGFKVLENEADVSLNVESYSTVIDTEVESYVALVLDASDSVTGNENLSALVEELRGVVQQLKPAAGEAAVHVSVVTFGRTHGQFVDWTSDLDAVDARLAELAADPQATLSAAFGGEWNGMGTALFNATCFGLYSTDFIRRQRENVTLGGKLAIGTVVVVSDGFDTSGADLCASDIAATTSQVLSIGISDDVVDADLNAIGRDGSFLAPTAADWPQAFGEIATRVDQYPERSYLMGYCSSLTVGAATVSVGLSGPIEANTTSTCNFNASRFDPSPPKCTADFFDNECTAKSCGGLTACGGCAAGECCVGTSCQLPGLPPICSTHKDCEIDGKVCFEEACVDPTALGQPCDSSVAACAPGAAYCDSMLLQCVAAKAQGTICDETAEECASLHCDRENPENLGLPFICLPPARVGDKCSSSTAICPQGAWCSGTCIPVLAEGHACGSDAQCNSGQCVDVVNVCGGTGTCQDVWQNYCPA